MSLRYAVLAIVLAAAPASAQTYGFFSQANLADGGPLTDIEPDCLIADADGSGAVFAFFDDTSDQIVVYFGDDDPGNRTEVVLDAATLTALTGATLDRCRDATSRNDGEEVYLVLADANNVNYVLAINNSGLFVLNDPSSPVDDSAGIVGVAVSNDGGTLYLTRSEFNGAPEDGVYTLDTSAPSQTPVALEINPDYDLNGIAVDTAGDLYVVSSEFGEGDFVNVVLKITVPATADPEILIAPCTDGTFTGCTNGEGGGIEDLLIETNWNDPSQQRLLVSNNAFDSDEGVQVASFALDGSGAELVFTSAALIAATEAEGFTVSGNTGYIGFANNVLYVGGRAAFGGTAGIASVEVFFPTAAEGTPDAAFALALVPNPTAGAARVAVTAETSGALTVDVLDLLGRRVATLFEGSAAAGQTVTVTTGGLSPGVYVVRAQSDAGVATQRLTVVR